jgi:hypothetical protein
MQNFDKTPTVSGGSNMRHCHPKPSTQTTAPNRHTEHSSISHYILILRLDSTRRVLTCVEPHSSRTSTADVLRDENNILIYCLIALKLDIVLLLQLVHIPFLRNGFSKLRLKKQIFLFCLVDPLVTCTSENRVPTLC